MNPLCFRFLLVCFLVWFCPLVGFGQFVQMGSDFVGSKIREELGANTSINQNGKVVALGMPLYDCNNGTGCGKVQIYEWHNNNWIKKGADIIGPGQGSHTGHAISLNANGNILAFATDGLVKVQEWNGTSWVQKGANITGIGGGNIGNSISISDDGNIVAVGSGGVPSVGYVKIYQWSGTNWIQKGSTLYGSVVGDKWGTVVSLNGYGDVIAISAYNSHSNGHNAGHTKIYAWNGTNWAQRGVDIVGAAAGDRLGHSMSINTDGSKIAIGAPGNDGNGFDAGHVRLYEWNGTNWVQRGSDIIGEAAYDNSGHSTSISADGNTVAIGAYKNAANYVAHGGDYGQTRIYDWSGTDWVQKGVDIDGETPDDYSGWSVSLSKDKNILIVGSPRNSNAGLVAGLARVFRLSNIYGLTYLDSNQDCIKNPLENGLSNRQLIINPGNIVIQTTTSGYWGLDSLPIGAYTITTDSNSDNNYQPCAPSYTFTVVHPDSLVEVQPIGYQAIQQCTSPSVSINMPFMRPGFSNQKVYVQACNDADATTILNNAYVIVTLDSLLTIDTASKIYTSLGNNTYQVNIGDLYPDQCANFWLNCTLSQNAILGSSLCLEAQLYPVDSCALDSIPNTNIGLPCTTLFDGSHLDIYGNCDNNDTISFTITNTEADMSCVSEVRLYIDGILVRTDSVQLLSNQSQTFTFPADGRTWRMEVDQHPLHWGNSQPSATIELCGNAANWTPDLVNILPQDDADPVVDIFCGLVTGSYDPNDKTGFPTGIGTSHDILPNQKIEYLIRFQNTGTDTAFTVVIRDTLSTDFDIFSVQSGVSSHDYSFRIYGPRVLEWTFNNIMLPDSNVNEPASNGFVKFEVMQQPNLPNGTVLENSAGIYFDFNAPIITNTSSHTINDGVIILDMTEPISQQMHLKVYPNPTDNVVTVELGISQEFSITVLNQLGQVLHTQQANGNSSQVSLGQLPVGIYYLHIHDGEQTAVQKVIKQ